MPIAAPTYRVEAGFTTTLAGAFIVGVSLIGVDVLGGVYDVADWTDVSSRVLGFSMARGREDELSGIAAGSGQIQALDTDGALDPENTSSPYYPDVKLMRGWRVVATYNSVDYGLHRGFATEYAAQPFAIDATVTVALTDLFTRLGRARTPADYPAQTLNARIRAFLLAIDWPVLLMDLDESTTTLPAATIGTSVTMLQHVADVLVVDRGDFWIDGDGIAVYRNRYHRYRQASRGVFGFGGIPIVGIVPSFNDAGLFNDVRVKRTAGTEQIASDLDSQAAYDVRTYSLSGGGADYLASDTDALSLATWILGKKSEPLQRVSSIDLVPELSPDVIWPHVLGAELGDRITISHDRPGTAGITSQDYFIERIEHSWSYRSGQRTTWGLSRAPDDMDEYLIIGSSTLGLIGTGKVAY